MRVTGETKLGEVLAIRGATKVLMKYRVPCLGCPLSGFEMGELDLESIARIYGIDLDGLLRELNEVAKSEGEC